MSPQVKDLGDELCDICKEISWSELAEKKYPHEIRPERVRPITESHASLKASPCRICRILAIIKPSSLDDETCRLCVVSSTIIREGSSIGTKKWNDCSYLAIEVKRPNHDSYRLLTENNLYIALLKDIHREYVGTTRVSPDEVNYEFIKEAMATCQEKHENCRYPRARNVADLQVIDCRTGAVIAAPEDCQYLALSYVWGNSSTNTTKSAGFTAVIHDSIKVTMSLGYHYLWVDRLCILNGAAHKMQMINAMDQIYSNASATIVAAAGEDADYGLPGVGVHSRREQAEVCVGDTTLLEHISINAATVLKSSTWASRAWTFQEGLLSNRRLIFTDQQVFFVCRDTFITESIKRPQEYTWSLDHKAFETTETIVPSYRQSLNNRTKETLMYMKAHISEYTKRNLQFEEDSLRAILGTMIFYSKKGIFHIWGVPVVNWGYTIRGNAIQLDWYHPQPAKRRAGFPSWSYTGWHGGIDWTSDAYNYDTEHCSCSISFTTANGTLTPITDIKRRHLSTKDGEYNISKYLTIKSRLVPLTFKYIQQNQPPKRWARRWNPPHYPLPQSGIFAIFPWTDNFSICAVPLLDTEGSLEFATTGLILHMVNRETKHEKGAHSGTFMVLILRSVGEEGKYEVDEKGKYEGVGMERYERIGIMMLDIDEAPAYLDGEGNVLDRQPDMIKTPYWREAIWFKGSQERVVELV